MRVPFNADWQFSQQARTNLMQTYLHWYFPPNYLPSIVLKLPFSLQSEKRLLHDSLKDGLEDKIHILEEDKTNVDFTSGLWELNSNKSSRQRRKADPLDPDRRKKPVTVTGPYIVYMLQESEIVDDWTQIKKSLTQRKIIDGKLLSVRWKKMRERFSIWQLYIYTRQAVKNKVNHLFMIVRSQ